MVDRGARTAVCCRMLTYIRSLTNDIDCIGCLCAHCACGFHVPRLSTHYTTAFRLSFALTVLRCKSVSSDQTRKLHEDCMLDWSGTLRSRGQCCPRGRSMPPPLDRLRLPSDSDTFPPPVHESVSGTLLDNDWSRAFTHYIYSTLESRVYSLHTTVQTTVTEIRIFMRRRRRR